MLIAHAGNVDDIIPRQSTSVSCIPLLRVDLHTDTKRMVFGILAAAVAVPAVVGTTEAVRQGQRQNAREEHRGRKSELVASLPAGSSASRQRREEFDGAIVVLWRNKVRI